MTPSLVRRHAGGHCGDDPHERGVHHGEYLDVAAEIGRDDQEGGGRDQGANSAHPGSLENGCGHRDEDGDRSREPEEVAWSPEQGDQREQAELKNGHREQDERRPTAAVDIEEERRTGWVTSGHDGKHKPICEGGRPFAVRFVPAR